MECRHTHTYTHINTHTHREKPAPVFLIVGPFGTVVFTCPNSPSFAGHLASPATFPQTNNSGICGHENHYRRSLHLVFDLTNEPLSSGVRMEQAPWEGHSDFQPQALKAPVNDRAQ